MFWWIKLMQYGKCIQCFQDESILKTIQHALQITELQVVNFCYEVKKKLRSILKLFSKISIHYLMQLGNLMNEIAEQFIVQWCRFLNKINGTQEREYETSFIIKKESMKCKKDKSKRKEKIRN